MRRNVYENKLQFKYFADLCTSRFEVIFKCVIALRLFKKYSGHVWVEVCEMIIRGTHQNALGLIEIISNRISVAAGSLDHPDSERSVSCYE